MKSKLPFYALIACCVVALGILLCSIALSMSRSKTKVRALPFSLPKAAPSAPASNSNKTTAETMTIVGTLIVDDSRKGTPLITNEKMTVFFDSEYLKTEPGKQAKAWNNKIVEAKGIVVTKECGLTDQCLSDGYMRFLQDISYISLIEK